MAIRKRRAAWRFADRDRRASLPNDPANASDMRSFVGECLHVAEVPDHVADEILMAVGEVVANACQHGRRPDGGNVELRCRVNEGSVAVVVSDDGPGFDVDTVRERRMPDLLSQGGRGFFLMRQLMDRVEVESSDSGTTVTLQRDLPRH